MSKYNKGDKFILEVDSEVYEGDMANLSPKYYTLKGLSGLAIIEESLDKLQKCETELSWDEAYIKGLEDAWDLARRLNNMTLDEVHKIYGFSIHREEVFSAVDAQEALAKIEAYEKSKEINVGDVVEQNEHKFVIIFVNNEFVNGIDENGRFSNILIENCKKTGKHIDITSVLEQLRGE